MQFLILVKETHHNETQTSQLVKRIASHHNSLQNKKKYGKSFVVNPYKITNQSSLGACSKVQANPTSENETNSNLSAKETSAAATTTTAYSERWKIKKIKH